MEQAGVVLDFHLAPAGGGELKAGDIAELVLTARDARNGLPVSGSHVSAWLLSRNPDPRGLDYSCEDKVRPLVNSHMGAKSDPGLNSYLMLALNQDRTITFVNPRLNYPHGKIENVVELPGDGFDWALTADGKFLLVTIPDRGIVAIIDTAFRRVAKLIDVGASARPGRVLIQGDNRLAWVGLDGGSAVAAIDLRRQAVVATLVTGAGRHDLALHTNNHLLYVTNADADTVSAIDTTLLQKTKDIPVEGGPGPIAFDPASRNFYVSSSAGGTVGVIDPNRAGVVHTLPFKPGIAAIAFQPGGRFGWVINPVAGQVSILDSATQDIVAEMSVPGEPSQVQFSDRLAYVYQRSSGNLTLFSTTASGSDRPAPQQLVLSQTKSQPLPQSGPASRIAITPDREWVFFANGADRNIPIYGDGVRAPLAAVGNEMRPPVAVLALNRGIVEVSSGVYQTTFMLPWGGAFDVPVLVDNVQHCFQVSVAGPAQPGIETSWVRLRAPQFLNADQLEAGRQVRLRMRLAGLSGAPLAKVSDIKLILYERPGIHQQYGRAVDVGGGEFVVPLRFDAPGVYTVLLSSRSQGAAVPVQIGKVTVLGEKK